MDFSPCFSSEAKYVRFGLSWVVLYFLFIAVPESQGQLLCVHWARLRVMTWGLWAFVELQGCGFWGELPTAGSEAGAPQGVLFGISFHFSSHPILHNPSAPVLQPFSTCIEIEIIVLSDRKLLRGLIRSCFWDLLLWWLRVGFWVLPWLSEVKYYCTLFILNFQSVIHQYFCKILKKNLNYEKWHKK